MKSPNAAVGRKLSGSRRIKTGRAHYATLRYLVSIVVLVLACIYAAPNLYPPDYAIQIQADNSMAMIDVGFVDGVSGFLAECRRPTRRGDTARGVAPISRCGSPTAGPSSRR